jgi:hypothetical protein
LTYGYEQRMPIDLIVPGEKMELYMGVDSYAAKVQSELAIANATVIKNTKCNILPHKIRHEKGSYVWLLDTQKRHGVPKKFSNRWRGPYQVEEIIDDANYKIKALVGKKASIVNKERLRKCFERKVLVELEAEAKRKALKKQGKDNESETEAETPEIEEEKAPQKKRGRKPKANNEAEATTSNDLSKEQKKKIRHVKKKKFLSKAKLDKIESTNRIMKNYTTVNK